MTSGFLRSWSVLTCSSVPTISFLQEVEREISFRTEQGLYYSYYKQLLNAPSLSSGLEQLQADNLTESTNTINILQRCIIVASFITKPFLYYAGSIFTKR